MARFECILFDMDGTLIDPKSGIIKCVNKTLREMDLPKLNDSDLEYFIGPPLVDAFMCKCMIEHEKAIQAVRIFRSNYAKEGIFDAMLYPGTKEALSALRGAGLHLFVATSKPTDFACKIAEHFSIAPYFTEIVGSNQDNTRSTKREVIEYILQAYEQKYTRSQMVMVGDRNHDLIGAKACGMAGIGVTFGYGTAEELKAEKPITIVDSFPLLTEWILG